MIIQCFNIIRLSVLYSKDFTKSAIDVVLDFIATVIRYVSHASLCIFYELITSRLK